MKFFISSAENGKKSGLTSLKEFKCKYYLYSYFHLRHKKDLLKYLKVTGEVFIDSGAHTLQKPGKEVDWGKFLQEYIEFINRYNKYINYTVELDVENKTGLKWVEMARERLIKETSIEPLVVWHRERGWDYYVDMCKRYKYVGFSGFVQDNTGQPEVPKRFIPLFARTAHKYGAKIHAFGYTRADLWRYDFDSVDSSSWTSGVRYASLMRFDKNCIKRHKDIKGFAKQSYDNVIKWNAREWVKYQTFLDNLNKK